MSETKTGVTWREKVAGGSGVSEEEGQRAVCGTCRIKLAYLNFVKGTLVASD